jgi:glyoxylase-like metal-dependent hydrolase (beta-lactamase superfamily II)
MKICESLALVGSFQFGLAGPLDCSVYALHGPEGLVLIDSGAGTHSDALLANLHEDLGDAPLHSVILTHSHADHAAGAASLKQRTGCRVLAPAISAETIVTANEEANGLAAARIAGVYPADFRMRPCPVDHAFDDAECLAAGGITFRAIHVRGHSTDAFCLLTQMGGANWLFSGDVIFYGGILGVINSAGSDMAGYRADLGKLGGLEIDGLFPGHGLFTLRGGQAHIDCAIEQSRNGFLARQIGQGDLIF